MIDMELRREVLPVGASCEEQRAQAQANPQTVVYYRETGCDTDLPAGSFREGSFVPGHPGSSGPLNEEDTVCSNTQASMRGPS